MTTPNENMPLLSIITPVFNRQDCVGQCLESVRRQIGASGASIEHIVVDDGSTDESFAVAADFASVNSYCKVFRLDRNRGTNAARNLAVRKATGRFIMLLDSDDCLADGALETIVKTIGENRGFSHFVFAVDDRVWAYKEWGYSEGDTAIFSFDDFLLERISGDFAHVLLRETMLKHPFDENLRIFEGIFFLSFYKEVGRVLFNNRVVINRERDRADRVTYTLIPDSKKSLCRHLDALELTFKSFGEDLEKSEAGRSILKKKLHRFHKFATLLGERKMVSDAEFRLKELNSKPSRLFCVVNSLHCGPMFFNCVRIYLKVKYKVKRVG